MLSGLFPCKCWRSSAGSAVLDTGRSVVPLGMQRLKLAGIHCRTLTDNMVVGFEKRLQLIGVGYHAMLEGRDLVLNPGFSHPVRMPIPDGLQVKTTPELLLVDMTSVPLFAASIRKWGPPEPYKGKGVKYVDEIVRRKEDHRGLHT